MNHLDGAAVATRPGLLHSLDDRWRTDLILDTSSHALDELWDVFVRSLDHLRERAAMKHTLRREDFDDLLADPRVVKVALRDAQDGLRVAGLVIASNDLAALPEPSADFYRSRWPEHYAAGRVWYVSYLVVAPEYLRTTAGPALIGFCLDLVSREHGGVIAVDVSEANERDVRFAQTLPRVAERLFDRASTGHRLDAQLYYAFEFPPAAGTPSERTR